MLLRFSPPVNGTSDSSNQQQATKVCQNLPLKPNVLKALNHGQNHSVASKNITAAYTVSVVLGLVIVQLPGTDA